jgi:glutaminyl-tRNA synthetase
MASGNLNLRDPVLYRIRHGVIHHQTGEEWCIYPMYDYTHPLSDALEGITHSLCTLEFEDHRPLYDWAVEHVSVPARPRQYEFARLNLQYTVLSKRKLTQLVDEGLVEGWDDPRVPTISGLQRRGYTPAAIRTFCERIGVTKAENYMEMELLEACIRDDLDRHAPRRMAVLHPLKVVIENYPEGEVERLTAANHPKDPSMGTREISFGREIWIDQADFRETANKKYKRLVLGEAVRLRNAYVIECTEVVKDEAGEIVELRARYFPGSLEGNSEGVKPRGVIHWVSVTHGVQAEVRLYDRLFKAPFPGRDSGDFLADLNPDSLRTLTQCILEPALAEAQLGERFQFEREGYFCLDSKACTPEQRVFNRTVTLKDTWAKHEVDA